MNLDYVLQLKAQLTEAEQQLARCPSNADPARIYLRGRVSFLKSEIDDAEVIGKCPACGTWYELGCCEWRSSSVTLIFQGFLIKSKLSAAVISEIAECVRKAFNEDGSPYIFLRRRIIAELRCKNGTT